MVNDESFQKDGANMENVKTYGITPFQSHKFSAERSTLHISIPK